MNITNIAASFDEHPGPYIITAMAILAGLYIVFEGLKKVIETIRSK